MTEYGAMDNNSFYRQPREYIEHMEGKRARPGQTLTEHVTNVAKYAAQFASKCGDAELSGIAGILHDLGKTQPEFQTYLDDKSAKRGSVQHSIFGARQIWGDLSAFPPFAEMLANAIAAHHGSLYNNLAPDGETPLLDELIKTTNLVESVPAQGMDAASLKARADALNAATPGGHSGWFFLSMLTKFIYSCLVDADRLDAMLSESGARYMPEKPDWDGMLARLEKKLNAFKSDSEMNALRARVSEACAKSGQLNRGIYKLEVPTGGGKTLASVRFALEHARKHGLDRIIYVIPYLSILSQTAKEIRSALDADESTVLEHHSNLLTRPDDEKNYKLHTDRWDAPIILTTQVQFLESVFSAKGSDLRKLHNMANSVLIFDEAQSLPIKCVHLFNGAVSFLNRVCGSTILLCTATQPLLDTVDRPLVFSQRESIAVCDSPPKRYEIRNALKQGGYAYPELAAFVLSKHKGSTLVIVNTKAAAKSLTEELAAAGVQALHLSTNMCSAHRDDVIKELRRRLDKKEDVVCVSTQLIEAGVDISFECVIRDLAGLDSIYQAAGRCNRHGEFGETKDVYVVDIKGENLSKLPDIKVGAEKTRRLFDEKSDDINLYYRYYFYERKNAMDFLLSESGSVYDLLSENERGKTAWKALMEREDRRGAKPPALRFAIRSAADEFYVIDRGRTDVVVPYNEKSIALIAQFRSLPDGDIAQKRRLLSDLGKHSVSLYKYQLDELEKRGALDKRDGIITLDSGFYNEKFGVNMEGHHAFLSV